MANPEHLKILKQGVEVWNLWRRENPEIRPNLENESLTELNLDGINFIETNLNYVDLSGASLQRAELVDSVMIKGKMTSANLSGATLSFSHFGGTDLSFSDCQEARIEWVDLSRAKLVGSNLQQCSLCGTIFFQTDLSGANLTGASLGETIFAEVDLHKAIGLDTIKHWTRSSIDLNTILSDDKIPLNFLRGTGMPEKFIKYLPSLKAEDSELCSCFISYSSKDQGFTERLYADLQNSGVRCWFAPEDMKIGDKIRDKIDESIRLHDKLLLVLSEHSINSDWVEDEVEAAYEQERTRDKTVLFPIRLDDAVMDTDKAWAAKLRRSRYIGDFRNWKNHDSYQKAFDRLLRDLKAEPIETTMIDPLGTFDWNSLYEKYDQACKGFQPGIESLYAFDPPPKTDRTLYYSLVDRVASEVSAQGRISIGSYEAILYWKLYSQPAAVANVCKKIRRDTTLQTEIRNNLSELRIYPVSQRNVSDIVLFLEKLKVAKLFGLNAPTAYPAKMTFLHFISPDVVPIFDKMVLKAVGVDDKNANQDLVFLKKYVPHSWQMAERHKDKMVGLKESPLRAIDMALWVIRGKDTQKCS